MKKLTLLLAALSLFACSKAERPSTEQSPTKVQEAKHVGAGPTIVNTVDVSGVKVPAEASAVEKLVLGIEQCPLEGYQVVPTCAGMAALTAGTKGKTASLDAQVGQRLVKHKSPAIRVKAAELMTDSTESRNAIADAAVTERDLGVLQAFIRVVASDGAKNPKVAGMLLATADHANKEIRLQTIDAIASPANRNLTGGAEKLVAMAEKDPDAKVRQTACEKGGKLGNKVFLPLYEKATATASDPEMYAACMEGLVAMFHNHPVFDTSNEEAYRLFLKRLDTKPRTEHTPPWNVMSTFCYFSHEADLDKLAAWKKQATYFNPGEVKRVITNVITDKSANWMARAAAVESMVGLGASKAELETLKKGFDASDRRDKPVIEKLASAIEH